MVFNNTNLEILINQLSDYNCNASEIKSNSYSYIKGANFIMENLLELYNKTMNSYGGKAKIYALNLTVNKSILSTFFKELKQDLGINDKLFDGGILDIPKAKTIINKLETQYNNTLINFEYFILGAKKVAKVIKYAYYAPLTKPFQNYIINESKDLVQNISQKLNDLR
ncbi:MAG: hypothetical protein PHN56_01970 [Candidatus Nanoarchaeia archaeon]|nr:hypothetical protein [Candidatus Nanoarchaeia archaeon]